MPIVIKIRNLFFNNKQIKVQMTNGAIYTGLFVATNAPSPGMEDAMRVIVGVAQNVKIKIIKQAKSFKKLNVPIFSLTSPPLTDAMMANMHTISKLVNLFVKPLMMKASKMLMQANMKRMPKHNSKRLNAGCSPPRTSNTMFAECPKIAKSASSHFFITFLYKT